MEQFNEIADKIALSLGAGWASGINLYAAILVLGLLGATGNMVLPEHFEILTNPIVISAAAIMYLIEFCADKIPGTDTGWDAVHTFIRIPAGAMLAASAVGTVDPAIAVATGILGGTLAASSHAAKAGSRILINTSPEPFTNWTVSIIEDVVVIGGLWTALNYPVVFLVLLILFIILLIFLLPKLWRAIKKVFGFIGRLFRYKPVDAGADMDGKQIPASGIEPDQIQQRLKKLQTLFEKGVLTQSEYEQQRLEIIKKI
ncbi:MAG: DUF4126 family protein [Desulfobacteraceae bacterium]|nr:DUF4126 family protein [Desulfobacteraceae bacterium]